MSTSRYRANVPDHGAGHSSQQQQQPDETEDAEKLPSDSQAEAEIDRPSSDEPVYKLQPMKWGVQTFTPDVRERVLTV